MQIKKIGFHIMSNFKDDDLYKKLYYNLSLTKIEKYEIAKQLVKKYPKSFHTVTKDIGLRRDTLYALLQDKPIFKKKKYSRKVLTDKEKKGIIEDSKLMPVYKVAVKYDISETAVYKVLSKNKINRKQEIKKTAYKTINLFIQSLKECGYSEKEIWEKIEEIERKHNMYGKDWYAEV